MTTEVLQIVRKYFAEPDSWLDTYMTMNPVWIAEICFPNSEEVIEIVDDYTRPGTSTNSWTRLKYLVEGEELVLKKLFIKWRKKKVLAVENAKAFFFARCLEADGFSGINFNFFLTGAVKDGIISLSKWRLPIVEFDSTERRNINQVKPEFIIWNHLLA
jgi:hypothetical protein